MLPLLATLVASHRIMTWYHLNLTKKTNIIPSTISIHIRTLIDWLIQYVLKDTLERIVRPLNISGWVGWNFLLRRDALFSEAFAVSFREGISPPSTWATKSKKQIDFPLYWLCNRASYNGLIESPYNPWRMGLKKLPTFGVSFLWNMFR